MKPRPSNTRPYYIWRPVKNREELIACKSNIRKIFRKFYLLCQFKSSFFINLDFRVFLRNSFVVPTSGLVYYFRNNCKRLVLDPHFSSKKISSIFFYLLYEKRKSMKG